MSLADEHHDLMIAYNAKINFIEWLLDIKLNLNIKELEIEFSKYQEENNEK